MPLITKRDIVNGIILACYVANVSLIFKVYFTMPVIDYRSSLLKLDIVKDKGDLMCCGDFK